MSELTLHDFLAALPVGRENAMTGRRLADALGTDDRTLRELIRQANEANVLVSADDAGYFVPLTADEAMPSVWRKQSQISTSQRRVRKELALIYQRFHPEQERLL